MNTTTTTRNKNSLANLASGNVIKTAWAIRKATAATHGVRVMLISWKSCLHAAMGKGRKRITDVAGYTIGSNASKLTAYIFDSETPVVLKMTEVIEAAPAKLCDRMVYDWFQIMLEKGYLQLAQAGRFITNGDKGCPGYYSEGITYMVVDNMRPYSNLIAA